MSIRILYLNDLLVLFEHDFFVKISRAFPLVNKLTLCNTCGQQKKKLIDQLNEHEQTCLIIEYSHLIQLYLKNAHIDYVKQFLFNSKTCLPRLNMLYVNYEDLMIVTENFTNDTAHDNCKIENKKFFDPTPIVYSENFYLYFPSL